MATQNKVCQVHVIAPFSVDRYTGGLDDIPCIKPNAAKVAAGDTLSALIEDRPICLDEGVAGIAIFSHELRKPFDRLASEYERNLFACSPQVSYEVKGLGHLASVGWRGVFHSDENGILVTHGASMFG